jgi:hypothetical protein
MMRRYFRSVALVMLAAVVGATAVGRAQSLTDVAKAEEARRKTVKRPAKVYTNDDLKPPTEAEAAAAATQAASASATSTLPAAAGPAVPAEPAEADARKTEAYWRERIMLARDTLGHDKVLVDAIQSRINALTTDFVNTSDPAQRALVETNRNTALAELDRLTRDIRVQTKLMVDTLEEARKAGVPAGWLR